MDARAGSFPTRPDPAYEGNTDPVPEPNQPPPFLSLAAGALSPVVLICEHASRRLPFPDRQPAPVRRVLASHWGWDIGAWALTRALSRALGASAVGGRWSRLLVDLNRRVDEPTLIRRSAGGVGLPWNEGLRPEEIERRILDYHSPYHVEVDRLLLRRLVRGIRPLVVALHTFTPQLDGRRRGFDVGVLYKDHRRLAWSLGRALRGRGLEVRYNQPYSGIAGMMYSVDRHGSHHGLPCLELEINQARLARPSDGAAVGRRLVPALRSLLEQAEI